jgi:hypothetical protein
MPWCDVGSRWMMWRPVAPECPTSAPEAEKPEYKRGVTSPKPLVFNAFSSTPWVIRTPDPRIRSPCRDQLPPYPSKYIQRKTNRYIVTDWGCLSSFETGCDYRGDILVTV